ncbi:GTP-binding protein At2g22870 [Magnolia sinica]|uniref:GTP-binding protein At2g22870 n=1 Tax=Magnolia sinica TaxID=86752 RepID=UPI00265B3045|nr:GTP-binding protein At2g22870 [Magnolia sinica]
MLLHHLPRFSSPVSISKTAATATLPIFFSTLFSKPNPNLSQTPLISTPRCFSSISSVPQHADIEIPQNSSIFEETQIEFHPNSPVPEETQIEIPLEKLFIPPEVDISADESALNRRVLKGSNIVLSRYARDAQISQAEFVKSSKRTEDCPSDGLPEFALVGRSNVGKSSLLNSLVRRKRLALTSKKPGKTQCINHFRVNDCWYLVDLPGYGYAAAPHEVRIDWAQFTKDYFLNRETLVSVFLLIDASIPAKKIDLEYASWLGQNQIPMTLIFTKCDKRKKKRKGGKRPEENVEDFQSLIREFFQATPPWIMTSSVTNMGRDEMLLHMAQLRNYWLKH